MNRKVGATRPRRPSRAVRRGLAAGAAGDFAKAFRFFRRAAASGEAEGAYRLGLMYLRGEGVVASLSDGVVWLRRAAEQGHEEAQHQLSLAYLQGGTNFGIARWYDAAAAIREDLAERNRDLIFPNGFSVEAAARGSLPLVPGGGGTGPCRGPGAARVSVRKRHRLRSRLRRGAAVVCARGRARPCPGRTRPRCHP